MTELRAVPAGKQPAEINRLIAVGVRPAVASLLAAATGRRRHIRHNQPGVSRVPAKPKTSPRRAKSTPVYGRPILDAKDAEILRCLQAARDHVIEVGRYRRSWTAADVDRVSRRWLYLPQPEKAPVVPIRPKPEKPVRQPPTPPKGGRPVTLTPTQEAVLNELCAGTGTNTAIARALSMSEDTVKTHMRRIMAALDARDRVHVVVLVLTDQVTVTVRRYRQDPA